MIEIFNIFFLLGTFFLIFSFPLNNIYLKKKLIKYDLNIFEIYSFNILFLLTVCFFLSFIKLNIFNIFFYIFSLAFLNLFFFDWKIFTNRIALIIVLFLFLLSYSLEISTYPYLEWDAAVNWIFKALNFKSNYAFENLKNVYGFIAYPHLGTYLWALFWEASFVDYEYTGRLVFVFIYLIGFFALVDNLKITTINKCLALIAIITICFDRILINGYQEPLMFSMCIIFMILLEKIIYNKNLYLSYLLLILCANLILWIKNEGMLILIFLSFFILLKKEFSFKNKIILFSIFIILILIKKNIYLSFLDEFYFGWKGYEFLKISELFSYNILQRLPFLLFQICISMIKYPIYLLFIACMLITLIKERSIMNNLSYIIFFFLNMAMAMSIFYATTDLNWKFHAKVGLDRMLYQTSGVYLFFILKFFKDSLFDRQIEKHKINQ